MKRSNKYISAVLTVLTAGFLLQGCGIQKGGQVKECPYDEYILLLTFLIILPIIRESNQDGLENWSRINSTWN